MSWVSFLDKGLVDEVRQEYGSPVYVYDERTLESQAVSALNMPNAFGLTVRYAMKALPTAAILRLFDELGLLFDASSSYEAHRAMAAGIKPERIQITAQEPPRDLERLLDSGVWFTACSLLQLEMYGKLRPNSEAGVRINPGLGSGHNDRTNTGGPSASFGIWREYVDRILEIQRKYGLRLKRMHTHIGSGSDPEIWTKCAKMSLEIAGRLPEVEHLSLGGGFKVARMPEENEADLHAIGLRVKADFEEFAMRTGRKLKMEIEPGTYLVANAGALVCTVVDVVDTGSVDTGYRFIKTDSGMTEIARPTMYGAQHPIEVVTGRQDDEMLEYVVVGHCCESGDILTPAPANPEGLLPRRLPRTEPGDAVVIGGAGAYCAAMCTKNYNSFPEASEVLLTKEGTLRLIRRRQTLEQMVENEM